MVSMMLLVFVALFFFCQLPNLVLHVMYAVNTSMGSVYSQSYMTHWANFLLIVNSSFNFAIYCLMSSFRDEAKKIFFFYRIYKPVRVIQRKAAIIINDEENCVSCHLDIETTKRPSLIEI
jgi:hypothetical protein